MTDETIDFEEWSDEGDVARVDGVAEGDAVRINVSEAARGKSAGPQKYRPIHRPPMGLLMIFDDGSENCETIRIRHDVTTIGRSADISIPHDPRIGTVHAKIVRTLNGNQYSWTIIAEPESSGMFVRAKRFRLCEGAQFFAGSNYFTYKAAIQTSKTELENRLSVGSLPGLSILDEGSGYPAIQHVNPGQKPSDLKPTWLISGDYWIGSNSACAICLPNDPFLAEQHVKISNNAKYWELLSYGATNGFWVRMDEVKVEKSCTFQLGEQRFRFTICP